MEQRAKAKIKHILDTHVPQTLTPEVDKEIDDILKRAKGQA
jgi:trimethylamine:corrinoid methyltransferase-like protein